VNKDAGILEVGNPTYYELSDLLDILVSNANENTDLNAIAYGLFGMTFSSRRINSKILDVLTEKVEKFNITDRTNLTFDSTGGLLLSLKVLKRNNRNISNTKQQELREFFNILKDLKWFKKTQIATLFLFSMADENYNDLKASASEFLKEELAKMMQDAKIRNDIGFIVYGLSFIDHYKEFENPRFQVVINEWLSKKYLPIESLCTLTLGLQESKSGLFQISLKVLETEFQNTKHRTIKGNLEIIYILMGVLYMLEFGYENVEIISRLKKMGIEEPILNKIKNISKHDTKIKIEFEDGTLPGSPVISTIAWYLFTMKELHMTDGYFITDKTKHNFDEFMKSLECKNKKVISNGAFGILLVTFDLLFGTLVFKYYSSIAEPLYLFLLGIWPEILKSLLGDLIKLIVLLLPSYIIINFNLMLINEGHITKLNLFSPTFTKEQIIKLIRRKK
jgi:hypothetical protein